MRGRLELRGNGPNLDSWGLVHRVIFIMGEPPGEAGIVGAVLGIADEASRCVAPRSEVLSQGRELRLQRGFPAHVKLMRPVAGEYARVRRESPGSGRSRFIEADSPPREPLQVRGGGARIAV